MADGQVTTWLRAAGLSRFGTRFAAANVATTDFLALLPTDLDALGVDSPADRKRLADLIAELRRARKMPPLQNTSLATNAHAQANHPQAQSFTHSNTRINQTADSRKLSVEKQLSSSWLGGRTSLAGSSLNENITHGSYSYQVQADAGGKPSTVSAALPPQLSRHASAGEASSRSAPVGPAVRVCVRKRPLSHKDIAAGERDIITTGSDDTLFVHEVKTRLDLSKYVDSHSFTFDNVFTEKHGNEDVYRATAQPLVDTLFAGGRATCFAYGQTGTGKTYTMEGEPGNPGLYILAVNDVFRRADEDPSLTVWISFFEIYGTRLHDLLNNRAKVECREDTQSEMRIVGITEKICSKPEHVLSLVRMAAAARSTGVTGANDDSSRSHAVFQIELRRLSETEQMAINHDMLDDHGLHVGNVYGSALDIDQASTARRTGTEIGRLSFIDLAGSERGGDTASSNLQTRREGAEINKSLLALKECIRAMDQRKDHTPFRGSKLTQVLKASFTGKSNCKTVMIANVSPASPNVEHTLNTLRYSQRVRELKSISPERGNAQANTYGVPSARVPIPRSMSTNYSIDGKRQTQNAHSLPYTADHLCMPSRQMSVEKGIGRTAAIGATPAKTTERLQNGVLARGTPSTNYVPSTPQQSGYVSRIPMGTPRGETTVRQTLGADRSDADGPLSTRVERRKAQYSRSMIPTPRTTGTRRLGAANEDSAAASLAEGCCNLSSRSRTRVHTFATFDNAATEDESSQSTVLSTSTCHVSDTSSTVAAAAAAANRLSTPKEISALMYENDEKLWRMNSSPSISRKQSATNGENDWVGLTRARSPLHELGSPENSDHGEDEPPCTGSVSKSVRGRKIKLPLRRRRQNPTSPTNTGSQHMSDAPTNNETSKATTDIVAVHRQKAEELNSLMREGVELLRALEAGRVAPSAYAALLENNLALSIDIMHSLRMQVSTLCAHEQR